MHQKVHSAVLDKEREHHIYNSIYIWFKNKSDNQKKTETFFFFSFWVWSSCFEAAWVWNKNKTSNKSVSVQIAATLGLAYCQCPYRSPRPPPPSAVGVSSSESRPPLLHAYPEHELHTRPLIKNKTFSKIQNKKKKVQVLKNKLFTVYTSTAPPRTASSEEHVSAGGSTAAGERCWTLQPRLHFLKMCSSKHGYKHGVK